MYCMFLAPPWVIFYLCHIGTEVIRSGLTPYFWNPFAKVKIRLISCKCLLLEGLSLEFNCGKVWFRWFSVVFFLQVVQIFHRNYVTVKLKLVVIVFFLSRTEFLKKVSTGWQEEPKDEGILSLRLLNCRKLVNISRSNCHRRTSSPHSSFV